MFLSGVLIISCSKENMPPVSIFNVSPHQGDSLTVFYFDAGKTYDPESPDFGIQIRWDWDGDAVWDTEYSRNKEYAMRFNSRGQQIVIMEAIDPEGMTSTTQDTIVLYEDNPFIDTITDPRDGNIYSIARMNGYWIMTENLRYGYSLPDSIWQTDNHQTEYYFFKADEQKSHYGGLYTWDEALDYDYHPGVQGICPPGWHVPEVYEWEDALSIFRSSGIDLLYYLGPESPSAFNLNFYGMMNFVNPGDSTTGYFYEHSKVAYWVSDKQFTILQDPDKRIQRIVFQRYNWEIVNHIYRRADHSNQDPLYTYASYVRCFKDRED